MPDLGHEVKDFQVFSWRLPNWKKLEKKLTSPDFECGGHKWWGSCNMFQQFLGWLYRFASQANSIVPLREFQCASEWHCICLPWLRRAQEVPRRVARMRPVRPSYLQSSRSNRLHCQPYVGSYSCCCVTYTHTALDRRKSPLYHGRVWLGFYTIQRAAQASQHTGRPYASNYRGRNRRYHRLCASTGGSNRRSMAQLCEVSPSIPPLCQ